MQGKFQHASYLGIFSLVIEKQFYMARILFICIKFRLTWILLSSTPSPSYLLSQASPWTKSELHAEEEDRNSQSRFLGCWNQQF